MNVLKQRINGTILYNRPIKQKKLTSEHSKLCASFDKLILNQLITYIESCTDNLTVVFLVI